MPTGSYFKGSGAKVRRDMMARYGKDWKSYFYGTAAKRHMRPGDPQNLVKPKKGWRKGQRARALLGRAFARRRKGKQ